MDCPHEMTIPKKSVKKPASLSSLTAGLRPGNENPRKLIIWGFGRSADEDFLYQRRRALIEVFHPYGVVEVVTPRNRGFVLVELRTVDLADRALAKLGTLYHMKRARYRRVRPRPLKTKSNFARRVHEIE